ncbi:MAG: PKD domain-containing protein [Victivallaceae bacterium]|nr:PKD domain-containing protein [Victivallaceae bacterium]
MRVWRFIPEAILYSLILLSAHTNTVHAACSAQWHFDEGSGTVAYDSSGNNDGTIHGASWVDGKADGALGFDGSDDYIDCGNGTGLELTTFSVEAWVNTSYSGGHQILVCKGAYMNNGWYLWLRSDQAIYLQVNNTSAAEQLISVPNAFTLNEWNHIAVTYDASTKTANFYVNGIWKGTDTGTIELTASPAHFYIGQYDNGSYRFNGAVDEVRIYDTLLTKEEIVIHSASGCWHFDEGSGTTAYDSSSGGNDGVIHGASWVNGKAGGALAFDGSDDYLDCGNDTDLELTTFSVEAWVNTNYSGGHQILACKGIYMNSGWYVWLRSDQAIYLQVNNTASAEQLQSVPNAFTLNEWNHIAVTYDASTKTANFYVNGIWKGTDTGTIELTASPAHFYIGQYDNGGYRFNGAVDEVRIYGRALTEEDIEERYTPPDCGAEANYTGDPFGGGPGYSDIITLQQADYVVTNKAELLDALEVAGSGDIVYVPDDAEIDLTGESNINIPAGVTLAGDRGCNNSKGGLIYTTQHDTIVWLLVAGGNAVRITGLRLRGPDLEIGDHYESQYSLSRGVLSSYPFFEVDNCELWGWSCAAVQLLDGCTDAYIHHNYIHHNRRAGWGGGVCVPGSSSYPADAVIEANIFDYNRHHIAANGREGSSYEARYNIVLEHSNSHSFDRHGWEVEESNWTGGDWTIIHHNTVRNSYRWAVKIRGVPIEEAEIYHNWFYHPDRARAIYLVYGDENVSIYNNCYGTVPPENTTLPVAVAAADHTSGTAPLTVSFDGSGSYASGGTIVSHQWNFADGNTAIGMEASGEEVNYTFNDPGKYNVVLTVRDDKGIPMKDTLPVTVYPDSANATLSFWVKDSYRDSLSGYFRKQVLIDGDLVWADDIYGDEGWQHVVTDVSSYVEGKSQVTLTMRVYCDTAVTDPENEITDLWIYWDDVVLFGGNVQNGDFESIGDWIYYETPAVSWYGEYTSGDVRSGNTAYAISSSYMEPISAGSYAQIEQVVNLQ